MRQGIKKVSAQCLISFGWAEEDIAGRWREPANGVARRP
jgi:hypothetical protein